MKPSKELIDGWRKQAEYTTGFHADRVRIVAELAAAWGAEQSQDGKRLDWIQRHLFGHKWNGVIDSGSRTHWDIWSGYRHETSKMVGNDFRAAIDAAMANAKLPSA